MKLRSLLRSNAGHSIMELIVGVALTGVVVPVGNHVISALSKSYNIQAEVSDMNINVRKVSQMISTDLRAAGYDPRKTGIIGLPFDATILQINKMPAISHEKNDQIQTITYIYSEETKSIIRTCNGVSEVVAENIQDFLFTYLDESDNIVASPDSQGNICKIEYVVIGRTAESDPQFNQNSGFRTTIFASTVIPRAQLYQ